MDAWLAVKWRRLLSARSTHPRGGIINSRLGPLSLSNPFTFTHDDASTRLFLSRRTEPNRDETRREASFFYSFSGKQRRGTRSRRPLTELITLRINTLRFSHFPVLSGNAMYRFYFIFTSGRAKVNNTRRVSNYRRLEKRFDDEAKNKSNRNEETHRERERERETR